MKTSTLQDNIPMIQESIEYEIPKQSTSPPESQSQTQLSSSSSDSSLGSIINSILSEFKQGFSAVISSLNSLNKNSSSQPQNTSSLSQNLDFSTMNANIGSNINQTMASSFSTSPTTQSEKQYQTQVQEYGLRDPFTVSSLQQNLSSPIADQVVKKIDSNIIVSPTVADSYTNTGGAQQQISPATPKGLFASAPPVDEYTATEASNLMQPPLSAGSRLQGGISVGKSPFEEITGINPSALASPQQGADLLNEMTNFISRTPELPQSAMPAASWTGGNNAFNAASEAKTYNTWMENGGSGYDITNPDTQFKLQPELMATTFAEVKAATVSPNYDYNYFGDRVFSDAQNAMMKSGDEQQRQTALGQVIPEYEAFAKNNPSITKQNMDLVNSTNAAIMPKNIGTFPVQEQIDRANLQAEMAPSLNSYQMNAVAIDAEKTERATWASSNNISLPVYHDAGTVSTAKPIATYTNTGQPLEQGSANYDILEGKNKRIDTDVAAQEHMGGIIKAVRGQAEQRNFELSPAGVSATLGQMSKDYPGIDWKGGGATDITSKSAYTTAYLSGQSEDWAKTAYKTGKSDVLSGAAKDLRSVESSMLKAKITTELDDSSLSANMDKIRSAFSALSSAGFEVPTKVLAQNEQATTAWNKEQGILAGVGGDFNKLEPGQQTSYTAAKEAKIASDSALLSNLSAVASTAETAAAGVAKVRSDEMIPASSTVGLDLQQLEVADLRGNVSEKASLTKKAIEDIETAQTKLGEQIVKADYDWSQNKSPENDSARANLRDQWWGYEKKQAGLEGELNKTWNDGSWGIPDIAKIGIPAQMAEKGITYNPFDTSGGSGVTPSPVINPPKDMEWPTAPTVPTTPAPEAFPFPIPTVPPKTPSIPGGGAGMTWLIDFSKDSSPVTGRTGLPGQSLSKEQQTWLEMSTTSKAGPLSGSSASQPGIMTGKTSTLVTVTITNHINISGAAGVTSVGSPIVTIMQSGMKQVAGGGAVAHGGN